ncbi:hypothetical protein JXB27_03230 [Candidatus Woesearchaeota archaeon]|nr:hypothetical protein [Candidatus Woesearchaeota archaeon]
MHPTKKEEFLHIFGVSLALIAAASMMYMIRTPVLTGSVVLESDSAANVAVVTVMILSSIALVLGAIVVVHKLKKELEKHSKAIVMGVPVKNLELASYVIKARRNGFNDSQIISKLKELGWKEIEIRRYLK